MIDRDGAYVCQPLQDPYWEARRLAELQIPHVIEEMLGELPIGVEPQNYPGRHKTRQGVGPGYSQIWEKE
jgi:hypothetical protein